MLFSAADTRTLFFGASAIWKSITSGQSWTAMSGDLSRASWTAPANVGTYRGSSDATSTRRGVVYTIAPSPINAKSIWAGTDDGLIHVTRDAGTTWATVTPAQLGPWAKVSIIRTRRTST